MKEAKKREIVDLGQDLLKVDVDDTGLVYVCNIFCVKGTVHEAYIGDRTEYVASFELIPAKDTFKGYERAELFVDKEKAKLWLYEQLRNVNRLNELFSQSYAYARQNDEL